MDEPSTYKMIYFGNNIPADLETVLDGVPDVPSTNFGIRGWHHKAKITTPAMIVHEYDSVTHNHGGIITVQRDGKTFSVTIFVGHDNKTKLDDVIEGYEYQMQESYLSRYGTPLTTLPTLTRKEVDDYSRYEEKAPYNEQ